MQTPTYTAEGGHATNPNMRENSIGLIGVGLLGSAIADRLGSKGRAVFGYDIDETKSLAASPQEVFDRCDAVILSLPTSNIASDVIRATKLESHHTIIDTTTGQPEEMALLNAYVRSHDAHYAEATVAGSSKQMRAGVATIFLACETAALANVIPIVDLLSNQVFKFENVGSAARFKLVHNLVLGLNRAVLAEGLVFAESLGFDAARTLEILKQTPAFSGVMDTKGNKMVEQNYELQARLSQHLKDVRLILEQAKQSGLTLKLSDQHRELLERAEQLGFADADNSAVIEAIRKP